MIVRDYLSVLDGVSFRKANPSGDRFDNEYQLVLDDDGVECLRPFGRVDRYQKIQAHHDSTKIENILARFYQGDNAALAKVQSVYADVVGAPKNLFEARQAIQRVVNSFEKLSPEIRERFGNNPDVFIQRMSSADSSFFDMLKVEQKDIDQKGVVINES